MVADMVTRQKGLGAAAAVVGDPVEVVDMMNSVSGSGTMPVPAHEAGDMLLVVLGDNKLNIPSLLSGFTNVTTGVFDSPYSGFDRSFRLQFIIDDDNSISSLSFSSSFDYGEGLVLRNAASVPNSSVLSNPSSLGTSNPVFPALSGLTAGNGNALVGGHYGIQNRNVVSVSGPFDDWVDLSGLAYKEDHALSSFVEGQYISYTGTVTRLTWCCEIEKGSL
jgi:hypothetical protein